MVRDGAQDSPRNNRRGAKELLEETREFDALARLVSATRTRRGAVAAFLGGALLGRSPDDAAAPAKRRKPRRKHRRKRRGGAAGRSAAVACFPGTDCVPGNGNTNAGCNFSGSEVFRDLDAQGAILTGANFTGADLPGATIGDSTALGDAVFCNTRMPDGTIDDSGCDPRTPCCPTCRDAASCPAGQSCRDGRCMPGECPPPGATVPEGFRLPTLQQLRSPGVVRQEHLLLCAIVREREVLFFEADLLRRQPVRLWGVLKARFGPTTRTPAQQRPTVRAERRGPRPTRRFRGPPDPASAT